MSERPALRESYASISELCELFGLTPRAIRFYEERGLIESSRDQANWRRYDGRARRRLALIAALRKADLPLNEIFEVLELEETSPAMQLRAITERLNRRLRHLDHERERLAHQIEQLRGAGVAGLLSRDSFRPSGRIALVE